MGFVFFIIFMVIAIAIVLMIRGYNYNHRIGEGMFKNSEYNLDEPDDFVDKNYYDEDALKKINRKPALNSGAVLFCRKHLFFGAKYGKIILLN